MAHSMNMYEKLNVELFPPFPPPLGWWEGTNDVIIISFLVYTPEEKRFELLRVLPAQLATETASP
jgi:hypothetical protein